MSRPSACRAPVIWPARAEGAHGGPEEQGQAPGPAHRVRLQKLEEGVVVEGPGRHHRRLVQVPAPGRQRHQLHLRPAKSAPGPLTLP